MPMGTDTDVIVIGAGLAGLGAATALRASGVRCVVLEASDRIGGRAWTTYPPSLGGVWFDMGAVWLHDAENNPLTPIAREHGDGLIRSDEIRREMTYVGTRPATDDEVRAYDAAWPRFERMADRLIAEQGDVALAEVARHLPDDPWAPTIEAWEGPVICTVDAALFSARDWRRNALGGVNLVPEGGIGAFVTRRLGQGLDIRLSTPVRRVRWNGPGGAVRVATDKGDITGRACIVTASTGVLAEDVIQFDPGLPSATRDAIANLPLGLAIKVALRANGTDRLDVPPHCSVDRQVAQGEVFMPFQCWPFQRDYVQGWIGGSTARSLARAGEAAILDHALGQVRSVFGSRVDRLFAGGGHVTTAWDADPWVRGAYSYATVHHADARDRLGEPLADGHLIFAGEACNVPYASTVAGAWISGQDAARVVAGVVRSG